MLIGASASVLRAGGVKIRIVAVMDSQYRRHSCTARLLTPLILLLLRVIVADPEQARMPRLDISTVNIHSQPACSLGVPARRPRRGAWSMEQTRTLPPTPLLLLLLLIPLLPTRPPIVAHSECTPPTRSRQERCLPLLLVPTRPILAHSESDASPNSSFPG
jgi:hypothetical protein